MASPVAPTPKTGDLILVGPGVNLDPGLYLVTGGATNGPYSVASPDNPRQSHATTVPKARILYVYQAD